MSVRERICEYYEALRSEEPLAPFFAVEPAPVKFGVHERLRGHDAIASALADQSRTTTEWCVDSHDLTAYQTDGVGWFVDAVELGWTSSETGVRYEFDTRWSGTLIQEQDSWRFVTMHVSVGYDYQHDVVAVINSPDHG